MINIERILCPTNLSLESDEALRYAVALARAYTAKLLLLYCSQLVPDDDYPLPEETLATVKDSFEDALVRHHGLANIAKLDWEGIVVEGAGDAGEEIVRLAALRSVDLIVMRSRRRPRAAAILGSTAEQVFRTAPCPVLVTHPHEREWVGLTTKEIDIQRVLVAHDFSDDSELAFRYAVSLAQEYQAELHVMHVLGHADSGESEFAWGSGTVETAYQIAARRLQHAIPAEALLWCPVISTVRCGRAYEEVLSYATEQEIDLVCMGARGKNASFGAVFGSNVDRVLRNAPCPVLVARPLRPAMSVLETRETQVPISRHPSDPEGKGVRS